MRLGMSYYLKDDVVFLAKDLIGKVLHSNINGIECAGLISETEAYAGVYDKASHAYGGRKTSRTEVMYREGGIAYIYLIYGIHHLFNIVSNVSNVPHAILLRGIVPMSGKTLMEERLGKQIKSYKQTNGPGKAAKCMGLEISMTGETLLGDRIWIEDKGINLTNADIETSARIGIDYAGEDAQLPYRFFIKEDWRKRNL